MMEFGIKPARGSQSVFLLQEADSTHEWNADDLRVFLKCVQVTELPAVRSDEGADAPSLSGRLDDGLRQVAKQIADEVPEAEVGALIDQIRATGRRPPQIDGRLLAISRSELGGSDLDSEQKSEVRDAFLDALEMRARLDEALAGEPDPPARSP